MSYPGWEHLKRIATSPMLSVWGATQALKESGSPRSVAASSGIWNPASPRGYLDMSRDGEVGVQQLFDVDLDSVSEAEEEPHRLS